MISDKFFILFLLICMHACYLFFSFSPLSPLRLPLPLSVCVCVCVYVFQHGFLLLPTSGMATQLQLHWREGRATLSESSMRFSTMNSGIFCSGNHKCHTVIIKIISFLNKFLNFYFLQTSFLYTYFASSSQPSLALNISLLSSVK